MPLLSDNRVSSSDVTMSIEEMSKDPAEVLAEAELQWMYSEEDLLHTPSILDGMSPDEERQLRSKGTNFITQVGIMLKLPQTTLCTASIFFNRFLMRHSLVKKEGYKPLHHYVSKTLFDP
jgi:protein BUR2